MDNREYMRAGFVLYVLALVENQRRLAEHALRAWQDAVMLGHFVLDRADADRQQQLAREQQLAAEFTHEEAEHDRMVVEFFDEVGLPEVERVESLHRFFFREILGLTDAELPEE